MKRTLFFSAIVLYTSLLYSQNIGISNDGAFTTPQSPLHIYWTSDGNLLQLSRSSAANTGLTFSVSSNDYSILNRQNNALIFGTNATERMRITNTGNVGIGTTAPANLLHLFSNTDATIQVQSNSAPNPSSLITNASGVITRFESIITPTAGARIITPGNYPIMFSTNNSERMRITNTGYVGIGTTTPAAQLHTTGTIRFANYASGASGAILRTNNAGDLDITNFTGNTGDILLGNGTFGSLNSYAWRLVGNSGTNPSSHFIGTTDAQDFVIRTNNVERMRAKSSGEFIVGGTDPGMSGDLFSVISLSSLPWCINGYANNNGGAFYGEIRTGNSTNFAVAEFDHNGSGNGACILAINNSTNTASDAGTGILGESSSGHNGSSYYTYNFAGVKGIGAFSSDQYSYGVVGIMSGYGRRSGGVMGTYSSSYWGALGYVRSNGNTYGLCYIGGVITGAKSTTNIHYGIGMGGWGELMGGHIKGEIYGLHVSGNRYSLYVNGLQFTNKTIIQLNSVENQQERIPTFMSTSLTNDIIDKGVVNIIPNTDVKIKFDEKFTKIIDKNEPIIITITPIGNNVNAYILSYDNTGFIIKCETTNNQNMNNQDNLKNYVKLNWIAIGTISKSINIPNEILSSEYDRNMDKFLENEADTTKTASSIWWDGQNLRFEPIPETAIEKKDLTKEDLHKSLNLKNNK